MRDRSPNTLSGGPDTTGPANGGSDRASPQNGGAPQGQQGNGTDPNAGNNPNIDQRVINYGEALRTAALKLVGDLPTLADMQSVTDATSYGASIDQYFADPRFVTRQIQWWRDTFQTGAAGMPTKAPAPNFDTAATFATEVVANDRPYTDLFTAATNTCPTFASGAFVDASCANNAPTAGVLTDPGLMAQYYADMAFRRVRFIQETFVCSKFPAEFTASPTIMGSGAYTSPWPFASITGGTTAKINFQDTSAVICANCHTTENHQAPLFGYFDMNGMYTAGQFQVKVPSPERRRQRSPTGCPRRKASPGATGRPSRTSRASARPSRQTPRSSSDVTASGTTPFARRRGQRSRDRSQRRDGPAP